MGPPGTSVLVHVWLQRWLLRRGQMLRLMAEPAHARSRSTSRGSTPAHRPSPSRLPISASLRPSPSLSNLNIQSHNTAPSHLTQLLAMSAVKAGDSVLNSSASSVIDMDAPIEGIMVQDMDADDQTDTEDLQALDRTSGSDDSKQLLRDQLRRTLSNKPAGNGTYAP